MDQHNHSGKGNWLKPWWLLILLAATFIAMHLGHLGDPLTGAHIQRQIAAHTIALHYADHDPNPFHPQLNEQGHSQQELLYQIPLFHWLTGMSHRVFGLDISVARIASLVVALLAVLGMFFLVSAITRHPLIAAATAWAFCFSPNIFYYAVTPSGDTFGLMLAIWSLAMFVRWLNHPRNASLGFSIALLVLAAWCDADFSIFFPIYLAYFVWEAIRSRTEKETHLSRATLVLLPAILLLSWQHIMPHQADGEFRPDLPFSQKLGHHLAVTLPELMLNYATLPLWLAGIILFFLKRKWQHPFALPLMVGGLAVTIQAFIKLSSSTEMHETAFFTLYPFLFLLVALGLSFMIGSEKKWIMISCMVMLLAMPVTAFLRMNGRWTPKQMGFNQDVLLHADEFRNASAPEAMWVTGNDPTGCVYLYYFDRRGWNFNNDRLNRSDLESFIRQGATHLVSDSRAVDGSDELRPLLGEPVLERGSLRLYKLSSTQH